MPVFSVRCPSGHKFKCGRLADDFRLASLLAGAQFNRSERKESAALSLPASFPVTRPVRTRPRLTTS